MKKNKINLVDLTREDLESLCLKLKKDNLITSIGFIIITLYALILTLVLIVL